LLLGLANLQNPFVAAIVLLNSISPSKLAEELELFGHEVWEALDISEVLFLCEQHRVDAVIIAADVEGGELIEKQLRGTVMRLKSNADAAYLDWELSQLFPKKDITIQ
jgi:predicted GTPase